MEQLAQLGVGLAGAGIASVAASDLKGVLNDIKFAKTTNGGIYSSGELKEVYNSIKESPNYPEGFQSRKNGTTSNKVIISSY